MPIGHGSYLTNTRIRVVSFLRLDELRPQQKLPVGRSIISPSHRLAAQLASRPRSLKSDCEMSLLVCLTSLFCLNADVSMYEYKHQEGCTWRASGSRYPECRQGQKEMKRSYAIKPLRDKDDRFIPVQTMYRALLYCDLMTSPMHSFLLSEQST